MQIVRNILTCAFVFVGVFLTASAAPPEFVSGHKALFDEYYTFLKIIASEPIEVQKEKLAAFIEAHPHFERPYHQLLTLFLQHDQLEEAEHFFKATASRSQQRRNSTWALAMLAAARDSNSVALHRLKQAIKHEAPSPYLLMKLVDYYRILAPQTSFKSMISELQLSPRDCNMAMAFYYIDSGEYAQCAYHLDQITEDPPFQLYARHMNSIVEQYRGNHAAAEAILRQGLSEAKAQHDEQFYIQFCLSLAHHITLSHYKEAVRLGKEALNRVQQINDIDRTILAHQTLGSIYSEYKQYKTALEHVECAYDLASQQSHLRSQANLSLQLSHIHLRLYQHTKALEFYNKSIDYAQKVHDVSSHIRALSGKGKVYMELNLINLADPEFAKAMQLAERTDNPIEHNLTIINWAAKLYEAGEFNKSRQLLNSALSSGHLDIRFQLYAYFHLASCYETEAKYDSALTIYQKICSLVDDHIDIKSTHYFKALALPQMAVIESSYGNFSRAEFYLSDPIILQELPDHADLGIDYYSCLALVHFRKGDFSKAINYYSNAVKYVEANRGKMNVEHFRISYFQKTSDVYEKLLNSYFYRYIAQPNRDDLLSIFDSLQRLSGRTLQDYPTLRKSTAYPQNYTAAVDSLQFLQRQLRDSVWKNESKMTAELDAQHDIARHTLISQRGLILDQEPSFIPPGVSLRRLQSVARANTIDVLFYHISDSVSFAVVVQSDSISIIPLDVKKATLAHHINTLLTPLHKASENNLDSISFHADIAHELYNMIFEPLHKKITLSKKLFIVPGMVLLNLPFEMLLTEAPVHHVYTPHDSADYAPLFLQHHHAFTYSPSVATLFKAGSQKSKSFIIFSNPAFYDSSLLAAADQLRSALRSIFMPLPYAEREAHRIQGVTNANHLSGKHVTKAAVLSGLQKFAIVHIATHAFVDSVFDAYSGLALATANARDDGLLMGYELLDASLNNDLIVLSACESGAGQFVAGEGVLGLPRLFLRAGASSVLMSLWKVHDPFPAHLMPGFYDFYLEQHTSKAEALALAKQRVLSDSHTGDLNYKHPFFWATFCLYGNPGLVERNNHQLFIFGIGIVLLLAVATFTFYTRQRNRS